MFDKTNVVGQDEEKMKMGRCLIFQNSENKLKKTFFSKAGLKRLGEIGFVRS